MAHGLFEPDLHVRARPHCRGDHPARQCDRRPDRHDQQQRSERSIAGSTRRRRSAGVDDRGDPGRAEFDLGDDLLCGRCSPGWNAIGDDQRLCDGLHGGQCVDRRSRLRNGIDQPGSGLDRGRRNCPGHNHPQQHERGKRSGGHVDGMPQSGLPGTVPSPRASRK